MYYAFFAFLFALALGLFTYFAMPRHPNNKYLIIPYILMVIMVFGVVVDMLGTSKPIALEWRSQERARVVGMYFDPFNKLVYLWILRGNEPYSYVMSFPNDEEREKVARKWRAREMSGERFFSDQDGNISIEQPEELPPK